MSPTKPARWPLFTALAVVTLTSSARADEDDVSRKRAEESYRGAQAAVARHDYAAAAAAFESAASFLPHPAAFLAAADAWERVGEPVRAAEDCDRALALPSLRAAATKDGVDYARDAKDCVARMAPKLSTLEVVGPVRFAVSIDGAAREPVPLRRRVRPGRHEVVVIDLTSSESRSLDVNVSARETKHIDVEPPKTAASAPPPPSSPAPSPSPPPATPVTTATPSAGASARPGADSSESAPSNVPTGAWVAFGVAGLGAIASAVFTVQLVDAQHSYQSHPTQSGRDDFYRNVALTDVALGVTLAAAVTGVVLWVTAPSAKSTAHAKNTVADGWHGVIRF